MLMMNGAGADVMKRIAAPMIGGIVTSGVMELMVFPVLYFIWRQRTLDQSLVPTGLDEIED